MIHPHGHKDTPKAIASCAQCHADYARTQEAATSKARAWLAQNPNAHPRVQTRILPPSKIHLTWTRATQLGLTDTNADGHALIDAILKDHTPRTEPTVGQVLRAIDTAKRIRP